MKKFLTALIFLGLLVGACSRNEAESQFYTFDNSVWERFNYLNFELPVKDTDPLYDISVVVRYTKDFPEDALYVNMVMTGPVGEERIRDFNIFLKDKDGNILGTPKGDIYERMVTLRKGVRFHSEGKVKFEVENLMTKVFTPGIVEFGVVLQPAD